MTNMQIIECLPMVNEVNQERVNELAQSMIVNGWQGAPILYCDNGLVTGSHRIEALKQIEQAYMDGEITTEQAKVLDQIEIMDVTEYVLTYCEENKMGFDEIDFSSLRYVFAGTPVEQYADQIVEW